jgi:hypothetical protein
MDWIHIIEIAIGFALGKLLYAFGDGFYQGVIGSGKYPID